MRILITNDDGISAPGLAVAEAIAAELAGPEGDVWVVAPAFEQSGVGHCVSYIRPMRIEPLEERRFAVEGSPADCVLAAIYDVLDATAYVTPALEIIDYRTEVPRTICDTIADNAAAGAMVTGGRVVRPLDIDLRWVGATLSKNGVIEESGVSAAVMGHPAAGIVWLANKLARHDITLEAGHILLAGSFTRPTGVVAGDVIHADYGPLGSISVSFS